MKKFLKALDGPYPDPEVLHYEIRTSQLYQNYPDLKIFRYMTELSQFGEFILEDIQLPENFEIIDVTQDYYLDPYTGCEGPAYNIAFNGLLNPGVYPISGTFKNIIYSDNFG